MQPIRFIHAADLHLDAAFSGISREAPSDLALRLQRSTFTALTRLVELCERERPNFLLLAGDVYNAEDQSLRAQLAVHDACARLSRLGIPVFIVHGNHDPLSSRVNSLRWPDSVTVFGEEVEAVPVGGGENGEPLAVVHGVSHASARETRNLAARFRRGPENCAHIGLLHAAPGDADGSSRYAPFSQEDLVASGMDYWALGHIHDRREVCRRPLAMYPGCPQGLHINEAGEKGCLLVTMTPSGEGDWTAKAEFRPLGPVQWDILEVALDDPASEAEASPAVKCGGKESASPELSLDALEERLRNALDEAAEKLRPGCEALVVRLRLTGRTALDGALRREAVAADLLERLREPGEHVWIKDMEVLTRLPVERGELAGRDDLLGEIFRLGDAGRAAPEKLEALRREALEPLFGHSRLRKVLEPLTETEMNRLLDDAESLCMDLLEND